MDIGWVGGEVGSAWRMVGCVAVGRCGVVWEYGLVGEKAARLVEKFDCTYLEKFKPLRGTRRLVRA